MGLNNPAYRAGGKIYPSKFVALSTGADYTVTQANASSMPLGISQDGSKLTPGVQALTAADLYAADTGDPVQVYGIGDVCLLEVGQAADLTAGVLVSPDANGAAVLTTTGKWVGAITLEAASKSVNGGVTNLVTVQVLSPYKTP